MKRRWFLAAIGAAVVAPKTLEAAPAIDERYWLGGQPLVNGVNLKSGSSFILSNSTVYELSSDFNWRALE